MNLHDTWQSVGLLMILGVPVIGIAASLYTSHIMQPFIRARLRGFGGWLLLLVIAQTIAPFSALGGISASEETYRAFLATGSPKAANVVHFDIAMYLVLALIETVVLVQMYRKSRLFRRLFLYQWIAMSLFIPANRIMVAATLGIPLRRIVGVADLIVELAFVIGIGVWVLYVFRSVRVRNTFIE